MHGTFTYYIQIFLFNYCVVVRIPKKPSYYFFDPKSHTRFPLTIRIGLMI